MHDFTPDPSVPDACDVCGLPEPNRTQHPAPPDVKAVENATTGWRDGETFEAIDYARLNAQARRVYDVMVDGVWRTLAEISERTGDPEASVSARLRDFRKAKFGTATVDRRRRGQDAGLWEYRCPDLPPIPADAPPAKGRKRPAPTPAPAPARAADDEPMLGDGDPTEIPPEPGYDARVYTDTTAWARNARSGRWQPLGRAGGGYSWSSLVRLFPNHTVERP